MATGRSRKTSLKLFQSNNNQVLFVIIIAHILSNTFFDREDKNGVVLKALDEDKGLKFLTQSWRYVRPGTETYLKKIIKHHITAGVYQNGDLVSGAIVNGHGLIGMLSTNPEHRNKGHAMKCMRYLMQEMTKKGFAIVSSSQQENSYSLALHDKLKFIQTHECDYIFHIPYHK